MKLYDEHLIIGYGEIGQSLHAVLAGNGKICVIADKNGQPTPSEPNKVQIMHICFPYSKNFIREVREYQKKYTPKYTVIHSTVPVGTSRKLKAIHSPVVGIHPHLEQSLKTFTKFLGGKQASEVADYFRKSGMKVYVFDKSETTELMKILDTTFYGICIEYTKEVKRLADKHGVPFEAWTVYNDGYNEGYKELGHPEFIRPNLVPIMTGQGGHCTQSNAVMLHEMNQNVFAKLLLSGGYATKAEKKLNDRVWLYCEYIGKGRSSVDIAKELGCSDVWVLKKLKEHKIFVRDRKWVASELERLASLIDIDDSIVSVSKKFSNRSYASIRNVVYKILGGKSNYKPGEETKKYDVRKKISVTLQGIEIEEWDGFKESLNSLIRKSEKMKEWKFKCLKRDKFACIKCLSKDYLEVDHIKPFSVYPRLRFDVKNGQTLCQNCHKKKTFSDWKYIKRKKSERKIKDLNKQYDKK